MLIIIVLFQGTKKFASGITSNRSILLLYYHCTCELLQCKSDYSNDYDNIKPFVPVDFGSTLPILSS